MNARYVKFKGFCEDWVCCFFARAEFEEWDLVEPLSQDRQVFTVLGGLSGTLSRVTELGMLAFKLLTNLDGTLFCVNMIAQLLGECF